MALNPPAFLLKVIWLTHFTLSSWALLNFLSTPNSYWYTHIGVLAFGAWAIIAHENADAVLMFLATLVVSILNDILILSLYQPRQNTVYEQYYYPSVTTSQRNEYRFSLGMCITNLILKPVSAFFLYRIYQSRANGSEFNASIPGLVTAPYTISGPRSGYNNIESSPGHTNVFPRPGEPPQYQAPSYQEAPPMGSPESGKAGYI